MVVGTGSTGDTVPVGSGVERCSHRQPGKYVHQVIVAQAIQDAFCKGLNGGQDRVVVLVGDAEADGADYVGYCHEQWLGQIDGLLVVGEQQVTQ